MNRYEQFNDLKKKNSDLVTMLAVGGWEYGTGYLSQMLLTVETREDFINSLINYLRKHNFDGTDLNFPSLGAVGSPPDDKIHFTSLIKVREIGALSFHSFTHSFIHPFIHSGDLYSASLQYY